MTDTLDNPEPVFPGWYLDPDGRTVERFWNGREWTEQQRPVSDPDNPGADTTGLFASSQTPDSTGEETNGRLANGRSSTEKPEKDQRSKPAPRMSDAPVDEDGIVTVESVNRKLASVAKKVAAAKNSAASPSSTVAATPVVADDDLAVSKAEAARAAIAPLTGASSSRTPLVETTPSRSKSTPEPIQATPIETAPKTPESIIAEVSRAALIKPALEKPVFEKPAVGRTDDAPPASERVTVDGAKPDATKPNPDSAETTAASTKKSTKAASIARESATNVDPANTKPERTNPDRAKPERTNPDRAKADNQSKGDTLAPTDGGQKTDGREKTDKPVNQPTNGGKPVSPPASDRRLFVVLGVAAAVAGAFLVGLLVGNRGSTSASSSTDTTEASVASSTTEPDDPSNLGADGADSDGDADDDFGADLEIALARVDELEADRETMAADLEAAQAATDDAVAVADNLAEHNELLQSWFTTQVISRSQGLWDREVARGCALEAPPTIEELSYTRDLEVIGTPADLFAAVEVCRAG